MFPLSEQGGKCSLPGRWTALVLARWKMLTELLKHISMQSLHEFISSEIITSKMRRNLGLCAGNKTHPVRILCQI